VPRSATVIATQPVELLQINWKMIKRLQWLYPPTAHRFFFNLMTLICDRLENLTECFSEIKMIDDATGLLDRENFLKILDSEIQRSRRCHTTLSLCFLKFNFDAAKTAPGNLEKERVLGRFGDLFSKEIGTCDTLSRFDQQTIALLIPHSSAAEAHHLCKRLKNLFEETRNTTEDIPVTLNLGLADFRLDTDESGSDLVARATADLQISEES
jgi:GGDEF domain-containing protein